MNRPTLIYDGDCEFCEYCVNYLKTVTKGEVTFSPYQNDSLYLKESDCAKSIYLVISETEMYRGAAAGFKTLSYGEDNRGWWLYQNLPGFSWLTEHLYQWITHHRHLCYKVAKIICGNPWRVGRLTFVFWSFIALFLLVAFFLKNSAKL